MNSIADVRAAVLDAYQRQEFQLDEGVQYSSVHHDLFSFGLAQITFRGVMKQTPDPDALNPLYIFLEGGHRGFARPTHNVSPMLANGLVPKLNSLSGNDDSWRYVSEGYYSKRPVQGAQVFCSPRGIEVGYDAIRDEREGELSEMYIWPDKQETVLEALETEHAEALVGVDVQKVYVMPVTDGDHALTSCLSMCLPFLDNHESYEIHHEFARVASDSFPVETIISRLQEGKALTIEELVALGESLPIIDDLVEAA